MAQPDALVPDLVGVRALRLLLGPGRDEALGVVVVDAGAQVIVAGGDLAAFGQRVVAALLDQVAERAPFLEPGLAAVGLALAGAQLLAARSISSSDDDAIGRHALEDEGGVRPEEVVAEVIDPGAARGHSNSFRYYSDVMAERSEVISLRLHIVLRAETASSRRCPPRNDVTAA